MRALGLWQPFASMVAIGLKPYETRLRVTNVRGDFVVCSTKRYAPEEVYLDVLRRLKAADRREPSEQPMGYALGIVELVDCWPMVATNEPRAWVAADAGEPGKVRHVWHCVRPRPFRKPFPVRCGQGWFEVDNKLVLAAL